ncbi:hypothetical protein [Sphingomonas sp. MMS24-J13]|uniref:hypothetical protein n=1 Tax=Sphingomonas sp. MMS24-J13 TaxID=3238686 RepID=UPI00384B545E
MRVKLATLLLLSGPASAEPAGPPAPVVVKVTAAQQAMANYRRNFAAVPLPQPCVRPKGNEVVVCGVGGRGGSADRLPLPDERGPPDHARTALNEPAPADASPVRTGSCGTQDQGEHCVGGISIVGAALAGVQIVRALVDPEGASDAADASAPHHP